MKWTLPAKLALAVVLAPVVLVGAYVVFLVTYSYYPELFFHREFYLACKSIRPGVTISAARTTMSGFLEVGRTWQPPATLPAGIFGAWTEHAESPREHDARLLFIPDGKNAADWCIVYPKGEVVARVEWSPD
ncbi:MAG TPA: hypothetical protein VGS22_27520 [Thermoanaerobaculia bacterium]|jgi:hypothetical protein|nr:hypothetical protein [Thermoanaerobaculia bacterium]